MARLLALTLIAWLAPFGTAVLAADASTASASTPGKPAADPRIEGRANCRFERPKLWPAGTTTWSGGCRGGYADGTGVIVNVLEPANAGQEPERFYGRLDRGYLRMGVVQTMEGFLAGNWTHGGLAKDLSDDVAQRKLLIAAFRVAASAAKTAGRTSAKKGDRQASRFYEAQARLLRDQMD